MLLSALVAASDDDVIGNQGSIPWHIPGEQAHAKEISMGKPLIMGRKTHESIGRTLPGRLNIVISGNPDFKPSQGAILAKSLDEAIGLAEVSHAREAIIFGGQTIYDEALPKLDRIYLTRVHGSFEGDSFFHFDADDWKVVSEEKHQKNSAAGIDYDFDYLVLERA